MVSQHHMHDLGFMRQVCAKLEVPTVSMHAS